MEKKRNSSVRSGALIRFWVVIAAIIGIFLASVGWLAGHIRQGLDLQGGTHIVMQAEDTEENKVTNEAITQVINIMQKRVNEMGRTVSSSSCRVKRIRRRPSKPLARPLSSSSRMRKAMSS